MSAIDDFINALTGSQNASPTAINNAEYDGNANDLLLRFEQNAGINVAGGTTLTSISPTTALGDLSNGVLSTAAIVWLVIAGVFLWWIMKK